MPRAQSIRSFQFPGHAFSDEAAAVDFESALAVEKTIPALVAAQTGTLTTRTDDDTGVATLSTGHGIETDDVCDVYFAAGVRYGMTASVSTNAITLDGGDGDALPTQDDPVTVVVQTPIEVNFDGDDCAIIGVIYQNFNNTGAKGSIDFQDTSGNSIEALDLVHEKANNGLGNIVNITGGDTNVYTGARITQAHASHNSLYAGKIIICVGITPT